MHTIFCCVREGEKQTTPIGRGRGYRTVCLIRNTISRQEEMKKLFTDLPEGFEFSEIVDKLKYTPKARRFYYPNLIFRGVFVCRRYC
jgi:DNA polymerase-3 subunit alpha